jgi:hypothetical protein
MFVYEFLKLQQELFIIIFIISVIIIIIIIGTLHGAIIFFSQVIFVLPKLNTPVWKTELSGFPRLADFTFF